MSVRSATSHATSRATCRLLVRQEVELAKAEMAEKGRIAAPGLGMIGGAGVVGADGRGCV